MGFCTRISAKGGHHTARPGAMGFECRDREGERGGGCLGGKHGPLSPSGHTHVLVRDDLHALHVAGRLEDLLQHVLGHAGVQAADVEGALVGLRGGTTRGGAVGRGDGAEGRRHAVVVRRNIQRRRHVGATGLGPVGEASGGRGGECGRWGCGGGGIGHGGRGLSAGEGLGEAEEGGERKGAAQK